MPEIADQPFDEPIEIAESDPAWEERYQAEAARLRAAVDADGRFSETLKGIEHFGSTSVPGLPAKPVIGLMCGIDAWEPPDELIELFMGLGYLYYGQMGRRRRQYLRRRDGQHFNIHIVVHGEDVWTDNLLFREYLSSHPEERDAYAEVKRGALAESGGQLSGYGSIKSAHMRGLLERAQWWDECGRDDERFASYLMRMTFQKRWRRALEAERVDAEARRLEIEAAVSDERIRRAIAADPDAEPPESGVLEESASIGTAIASVMGVRAGDIAVDSMAPYVRNAILGRLSEHGIALPDLDPHAYARAFALVETATAERAADAAEGRRIIARFERLGDDERFSEWFGQSPRETRWSRYALAQLVDLERRWEEMHEPLPSLSAHEWWDAQWGEIDEIAPGVLIARPPRNPFGGRVQAQYGARPPRAPKPRKPSLAPNPGFVDALKAGKPKTAYKAARRARARKGPKPATDPPGAVEPTEAPAPDVDILSAWLKQRGE